MVEPKFLLVSTTHTQARRNQTNLPNIQSGSPIEDTKSQSTTYSNQFPTFLLVLTTTHTHTHARTQARRKKQANPNPKTFKVAVKDPSQKKII
jgi:hypothetical protein